MGLLKNKLELFQDIHQEVTNELGLPSALIHLTCNPEIQLSRIKERSRPEERLITLEFLDSLNAAVQNEVNNIKEKIRVIEIDSGKDDLVNDKDVRSKSLGLIESAMNKID